jgi:hypothetical protein
VAVRLFGAEGVNTMLTVHEVLVAGETGAASCEPQLLVCEKSLALVPLNTMEVKSSGPVPVFDTTNCWAADFVFSTCAVVNVTLVGDRLTTGAVPLPESDTGVKATAASLVMVSVAVWMPVAVGLNTTLMAHELEAGTVFPQLLVAVNCAAEAPVTATLLMFTTKLELLTSVTD